ncbi:MAG TPA: helix-turn-helix domain-containing protein [Acidimicrobiales bacterium]|nr:helix-turn-helix domain-containing protein [Acidimicrobiales bacterium]
MAPPQTNFDREATRAAVDDRLPDGEPGSVVRRAPFSDNPQVGARGQRTQQRILDAALRVFGEEGYHRCGIDRITEVAGCSRASFYQYFAGKEDVFRHLAGQVARQLSASIEALGPLTADADGWTATRAWVGRFADIYERYEPVFQVFQAAAESDEAVAGGSERTGERHLSSLRSRLATTTLPPRQLDPVITLLLECLPRTLADAAILRSLTPAAYPKERVEDTLADVVHRTLFGLHADVNAHSPASRRPPVLEFGPVMREALQQEDAARDLNAAGRRTLQALVEAGRDVFVARGYHRTRIDDVVAAARVAHGAFYRYFQSKDQFAHILAVRAMRTVSTALADIPAAAAQGGPAGRAGLRRWLRRYNAMQAAEAAMIRVWIDAAREDATLRADSAAVLDWARRRMVDFLRPRDFGDVDTDAVMMVALLGEFGARERSAATVDAAAHIIERGFLGR